MGDRQTKEAKEDPRNKDTRDKRAKEAKEDTKGRQAKGAKEASQDLRAKEAREDGHNRATQTKPAHTQLRVGGRLHRAVKDGKPRHK